MDSEKRNEENIHRAHHTPWWMGLIIIVCALPGAAFPALLTLTDGDPIVKGLLWFYPFYVLATAILAWQCYGRRTLLCWLLLAVMVLTHIAMFTLVMFVPKVASPFL